MPEWWEPSRGSGLTFPFEPGGVWFVLEALDPMPDVTLMEAGKELTHGLLSPGSAVEVCLLTRSGSTFPVSKRFHLDGIARATSVAFPCMRHYYSSSCRSGTVSRSSASALRILGSVGNLCIGLNFGFGTQPRRGCRR